MLDLEHESGILFQNATRRTGINAMICRNADDQESRQALPPGDVTGADVTGATVLPQSRKPASEPGRRTATRAMRREQLMRSTIESIAQRGFAETTLADVADGAGLSRGIVNFHFRSKDQLLDETLQFLADEYRAVWQRYLERADDDAAKRLLALVLADYDPAVCNRKKLAVWFAFWGETKSRPNYMRLMGDRDAEYEGALRQICSAVIEEGGYGLDVDMAAASLSSFSDGMWLALLVTPRKLTRERAKRMSLLQLSRLFPAHYDEDGNVLRAKKR